jgi:hypothetical protein
MQPVYAGYKHGTLTLGFYVGVNFLPGLSQPFPLSLPMNAPSRNSFSRDIRAIFCVGVKA